MESLTEVRIPGIGQVREPRADAVGVDAQQRAQAGQVEVVGERHQRARRPGCVDTTGGIGEQDPWRTEATHEQHRLDDEARWVAFVAVQPPLEADDRQPGDGPQQEAACVAGRGGSRPAGQVSEGDGDRALDAAGQSAEPRAQDDAEPRHEVGAGTDDSLEGGESSRQVVEGEIVWHRRQDTSRRASRRLRDVGGADRGLLRSEEVSTPGCRSHPSDRSHRGRPRRDARPWARKRPKRPTGRLPPPCGQLRRP